MRKGKGEKKPGWVRVGFIEPDGVKVGKQDGCIGGCWVTLALYNTIAP